MIFFDIDRAELSHEQHRRSSAVCAKYFSIDDEVIGRTPALQKLNTAFLLFFMPSPINRRKQKLPFA
jgi:hypothetical protein